MPDETLHVDRFILTQPREWAGGGWIYAATSPDDPAGYIAWVYPNPCHGADLQEILGAVDRAAAIRHPRLLKLHAAGHKRPAIGPQAGYLYAITDCIDETRSVERLVLPQAPLPIDSLLEGLHELVAAIGAMASFPHSHGWLGPEHCFVDEAGHLLVVNPWQGWVLDRLRQNLTTGTSDWQYTWVAPETVFDPSLIDIGSDLFTACAIGYTLATGQVPFDSATALTLDPALFQLQVPDPRNLRSDLPEGLARILQRGLAQRPEHRYHDAATMADDLRLVMNGGVPGARTPEPPASAPAGSSSGRMAVATPSTRRQRGISSSGRLVASSDRASRSANGTSSVITRGPRSRPHPRSATGPGGGDPLPIIAVVVAVAVLLIVAGLAIFGRTPAPLLEPADSTPLRADRSSDVNSSGQAAQRPPPSRLHTPFGLDSVPQQDHRFPTAPDWTPPSEERRQPGGLAALEVDPSTEPETSLPAIEAPAYHEAIQLEVDALRPGLVRRSYRGYWSQLPDFGPLQPVAEGVIHAIDLEGRPADHEFGMVFEGYVEIPHDAAYSFVLEVDDAARLRIAGTGLILSDVPDRGGDKRGVISLRAGYHPIRIEYLQGYGDLWLGLRWQSAAFDEKDFDAALHHLPAGRSPTTLPAPVPVPVAESEGTGSTIAAESQATATATQRMDAADIERVRTAIAAVLAGGRAPRELGEPWSGLLLDLGRARDRLPVVVRDQAKRIAGRHVTVELHRTELEVRGLDATGLDFSTTDGRSQVRMGWDKIGMTQMVAMLRAVLYDLSPDDRDDLRLVASALGPIDPKLQRHRETLERLQLRAPAAEPEPATPSECLNAERPSR